LWSAIVEDGGEELDDRKQTEPVSAAAYLKKVTHQTRKSQDGFDKSIRLLSIFRPSPTPSDSSKVEPTCWRFVLKALERAG